MVCYQWSGGNFLIPIICGRYLITNIFTGINIKIESVATSKELSSDGIINASITKLARGLLNL